jgi:hypothetical protein
MDPDELIKQVTKEKDKINKLDEKISFNKKLLRNYLKIMFFLIIGIFIFAFIFALIIQWAWNGSVSIIFGWKALTYWTSFKLMLLTGFLFGTMNVKK